MTRDDSRVRPAPTPANPTYVDDTPPESVGRWNWIHAAQWPLWQLPPAAIVYVLFWDLAAVALAVALQGEIRRDEVGLALLLAVLCMLQIEAVLSAERTRRRVAADSPRHREAAFVAPTAVWTMAGVLVLSPGLIAVLAGVVYGYRFLRVERPRLAHARGPGYRGVFTAASIVLAGLAGWALLVSTGFDPRAQLAGPLPLVIVLGSVVVYSVVQFGLVAGAVALAAQSTAPARIMLASWDQHGTEFVQLCIGAAAAILLTSPAPWTTALLAPALWLLTRAALASQLEQEADIDVETGLLTAASWHRRAASQMSRSRRRGTALGILLVDVDSLRTINARFGSQAGDRVLVDIANALRSAVRPDDRIGRLHGEEFAIIAPSSGAAELTRLADGLGRAVRELDLRDAITSAASTDPPIQAPVAQLTISVGVAEWPLDGDTVDTVLAAADTALRDAKQRGPGSVALPNRERSGTAG